MERELKAEGGVAERQSGREREERAARGEGILIGEIATGELQDERTPMNGICDEVNDRLKEQGFEPTCTLERAEAFYAAFSIDRNHTLSRSESQLDRAWEQIDKLAEDLSKTQDSHRLSKFEDHH